MSSFKAQSGIKPTSLDPHQTLDCPKTPSDISKSISLKSNWSSESPDQTAWKNRVVLIWDNLGF